MTTTPVKPTRIARRVLELAAHDAQLQELMSDPDVVEAITRPGHTLADVVAAMLTGYRSRPALGERRYEVTSEPGTERRVRRLLPQFATTTYDELRRRVEGVAGTWQHDDHHRVDDGEFVCILGFAGTDYVTIDLACVYAHAVAVPLQTTLTESDLDRIFTDTAPVTVAAPVSDLVAAAQLAGRHRCVRSIVVMGFDERVDDDREQWSAAEAELTRTGSAARVVTLDQLITLGETHPWEPLPPAPDSDDRMVLLVHSSGSTGTPKGAVILGRYAKFQFTNMPPTPLPVVRLCFAPLNHFMGRGAVFNTIARGGTAFFTASPDMSTLFEDFRLVRPTEAVVFPRVLDMIHHHYLNQVASRVASGLHPDEARGQVMREMRYTFLGDRISSLWGGSAPAKPEVLAFVKDCFPAAYAEGYGMTEAGGSVTVRDRINRAEVLDYRLRDVPDHGYYSTDKPYPRGELCVKTRLAVPGYYKNPEATAALFDEEGYLRTGDIMEERGPDHLVYIDRRNDVLKLAQGEFVTVGALGNTYESGAAVIQQIFIYGTSSRSYLLAVVVPRRHMVEDALGRDPSDAAVKDLIRSELQRVAREQSLRSFEVPRDFIIENEPFSAANGLLSSVSKRLRPKLLAKYGARLEELYTEMDRKQNEELLALRDPKSSLTVAEKIGKALEATLGVEGIDVTQPYSFAELGGDSLAAAAFSVLLTDIFGVEVPANTILSPAGTPKRWAQAIEESLRPDHRVRRTAALLHGVGARQLDATDLDIANFIEPAVFDAAPLAPPPADSRTVLITGATGFLGRFLCLEWLERLAPVNGKVICLVRGRDERAAAQRLAAAFAGDERLERRFGELAAHLEVVVGDVAETALGLSEETYERLAEEVDRIVHPAALVNHVLDYEYLFGPNVAGTAELVRLALTRRQKRFDFVSSQAVIAYLDRSAGIDEDAPLRPTINLSQRYSAHYGASKWAAEQLLQSVHRRVGLPVNVFRGDMILPHQRFRGQLNTPDVFVRLLCSIVTTGLAPMSFYEPAADGSRARAHYDGLPVDFFAAALVGISADPHGEIRTFHVLNPHDDGVSLDSFVDWIGAAGYPIERIAPHGEWLTRFEDRLRSLPDEQRQQSSLAVLDSLRRPAPSRPAAVGSDVFVGAVHRLGIAGDVPHLSEEYIGKCLDDLRLLGLIPAPTRPRSPDEGAGVVDSVSEHLVGELRI